MPTLNIQLLGEFHITYDTQPQDGTQPIFITSPRQQSLLSYLLLHRQVPQPRQRLAFLLWPDSSESQAFNNLRKNLHHLRQMIPDSASFLYIDNTHIQWRSSAPFLLDVAEFEAKLATSAQPDSIVNEAGQRSTLESAVRLYRGDLLPNCYDDWVLGPRERLHTRYMVAIASLIAMLERLRDYPAAISHAQRLLHHDPLHEAAYEHLMRLHLLNGDRTSALNVYDACVTMLQAELEIEPNQEIRALYQQVIQQQATPGSYLQLDKNPDRQQKLLPHHRDALVGRHQEWQKLLAAWEWATKERAHFVLIRGEAGIGKTRLVEEMLTWAGNQGIAVAYARSYAAEGALAYEPVTEWLQNGNFRLKWQVLDPIWLSELSRLLPEILIENPNLSPAEPLVETWQRKRLFEALARATLAVTSTPELSGRSTLERCPLLLVIDDLQWCDRETLEWLHYLLRYDPYAPVLLVGTARGEEISDTHPLVTLQHALVQSEQITEIELGPLDEAESTALVAQVTDRHFNSQSVTDIYQSTEGNPLFIVETIRAYNQKEAQPEAKLSDLPSATGLSIPPKIYVIVQRRLVQLSPEAQGLAYLAAVIGRSFALSVLAEASDLEEEMFIDSLDELWQRRIVRDLGNGTYDFTHDRIREIAYAETSVIRRRLLHKRVALALEELYPDQTDDLSGQLGLHYAEAELWSDALSHYQTAADVSMAISALNDVLFYSEKVVDILDGLPATPEYVAWRIDSYFLITRALLGVHGWTYPERKRVLDLAYSLAEESRDEYRQILALQQLGAYYCNIEDMYRTYQVSQELLERTKRLHDDYMLHAAYYQAGYSSFHLGEFLAARGYYQQALNIEESMSPNWPQDTSARVKMAETLWICGYPEQAYAMGLTILQADEKLSPHVRIHRREFMMYTAHRAGDISTMLRLTNEEMDLCAEFNYPDYALVAQLALGWLMAEEGNVEGGLIQMQESLTRQAQMGVYFNLPYFLSMLAQTQRKAEQIDEALISLARALQTADSSGDLYWKAEILRLTGESRLQARHAVFEVEQLYQASLVVARQQGAKMLELRTTVSLARLWQSQGRSIEAYESLAAIYGWFTEGFDTIDLKDAKALLQELEAESIRA